MKLTGKNRSTREKFCPSATLSTTNPIQTDTGSNLRFRGGRPATNCLSHGTAVTLCRIFEQIFLFLNVKNFKNHLPANMQLIRHQFQGHSTVSGHEFANFENSFRILST
jgi:hypothetical protein